MIEIRNDVDQEQFEQLRSQSVEAGAGKMRYAAAMYFYQRAALSENVLEIYRSLANDDVADPLSVIVALGGQFETGERPES